MFSSEVTEVRKVTLLDLLNERPNISKLIFSGKMFILRQTSKTIYDMLKNANIRIAIKNKYNYKGKTLLEKLNSLNIWCKVIKLDLIKCNLGDVSAREIASMLRVNSTLQKLELYDNVIGDNGARAIAEALRVNTTLHTLALWCNRVGDNGARAIAEALRVNSKLHSLDLSYNHVGADGARAIVEALRVNSTLQSLNFEFNNIGADDVRAFRKSWGNRKGTLHI